MKWNPHAKLGPDALGPYFYLGDPANLPRARTCLGHAVLSQADLQALAAIFLDDREWNAGKPQTYVVTVDGVFRLGGYLNEHVEVAGGGPVLAAGEAFLDRGTDGMWRITALNNRSYGYMPNAVSWAAVDRASAKAGIPYTRNGFSEVYPNEGTWAELLVLLLE